MKKIVMVLIAMVGFVFVANAQQAKASVPGDNGNTVIVFVSNDSQTSTSITIYNNSTKSITVYVSILNDQGSEVGKDSFSVPAAPAQGSSSKSTGTISKIRPCSSTTSGCEVKQIRITKVTVQN